MMQLAFLFNPQAYSSLHKGMPADTPWSLVDKQACKLQKQVMEFRFSHHPFGFMHICTRPYKIFRFLFKFVIWSKWPNMLCVSICNHWCCFGLHTLFYTYLYSLPKKKYKCILAYSLVKCLFRQFFYHTSLWMYVSISVLLVLFKDMASFLNIQVNHLTGLTFTQWKVHVGVTMHYF